MSVMVQVGHLAVFVLKYNAGSFKLLEKQTFYLFGQNFFGRKVELHFHLIF